MLKFVDFFSLYLYNNRMVKKVTIHDIAREAGVSSATVSYIINNRPDKSISEQTRQKVLHLVNLYNYKPGAFAKNLRASPDSKLISVYTGKTDNALYNGEFMYFVESLQKVFPNEKYGIILSGMPYRHLDNVDAIIAYNIDRDSFITIGKFNYVPLISVDCIVKDTLFFQITADLNKLKNQAMERFGNDFCFACLTPLDGSLKEEILSIFDNVIFVESMSDLNTLNNRKKILTTDKIIMEYLSDGNHQVYFPDTLMQNKCEQTLTCLEKVLQRVPFDTHYYKV